jgi:alkyl hydroperoxide reductase subunit AhpC
MTELRGLAQRASEFEKLKVKVVAISVDDLQHGHDVWEKVAEKKITVLNDPGAQVIRKYGLLHAAGQGGQDIALRTTLLVDPDGIEKWRRVSHSVPDIPTVDETLAKVKESQALPAERNRQH